MAKNNKILQKISALGLATAPFWLFFGSAGAAGAATLTLSPSSGSYTVGNTFSVTIRENSGGELVNAIEADLTYDQAKLQIAETCAKSVDTTVGAFELTGSKTCSSGLIKIGIATASAVSGTQTIATVTFRVLAAGTTNMTFVSNSGSSGSAIIKQSGAENIWNGNTAGGTYTLANPASTTPTATPKPTAASGASSSSTSSNSSSTNSSNNNSAVNSSASTTGSSDSQTTVSTTGHLVAIKVVDSNNKPLNGIKVTLDTGQTAVTDATGTASFTNIAPGKHTVKAVIDGKTNSKVIDVKGVTTEVQQFALSPTSNQKSYTIPIIVGLAGLAVLLAVGFILRKRLGRRYEPLGGIGGSITPANILDNGYRPSATTANGQAQILRGNPSAVGTVFSPASGMGQAATSTTNNEPLDREANHDQT